ncbi:Uncharacterized membrane protein [Desulfonatronum thiosulfatophilum]|uniref:Uncharacterized membrane protein n=1 Tax=Desulfonatronum thiosulfatophilum TaxID=617002 RepID=A0A1G6B0X6_9BACT|nr:DUF2254 domain-containing protein [Desulfonatronum thiosulfatophilum]SDB14222.1 Uncharacterized membrane protein [Desulfonatronum thiosulfatophilum]
MKAQFLKIFVKIRSSLWFTPGVMSSVAVALAFLTITMNDPMADFFESLGWTFSGGAEGASAVLKTIAGSMITIAGVVFSITLVALSLVTSQLGPRLLRNFMRDTTTQVVLGTFVATFLYCLIVLRTVRRSDSSGDTEFVPHLSVTLGVFFAVLSVGVLIYFIHHVSVSIQANRVVARVGNELLTTIDHLYPKKPAKDTPQKEERPSADFLDMFSRKSRPVPATTDGYIQFIDKEVLMEWAVKEDAVIRLEQQPGRYIVAGQPLVRIWPEDKITDQLPKRINRAFALDDERTPSQDVEFAVLELVEIALRALSPSLNDPFTAIACIDQLGTALCRLAQRNIPSPYLFDEGKQLRIIAPTRGFSEITDAAFNQIRHNVRSSVQIFIHLLDTIATVAYFAHRPEDQATLLRHAEMLVRGAREGLPEELDRWVVEERYQAVVRLCNEPRPGLEQDIDRQPNANETSLVS